MIEPKLMSDECLAKATVTVEAMTAWSRNDREPSECVRCHEMCAPALGDDPTPLCHQCAHAIVEDVPDLLAHIVALTAERDAARTVIALSRERDQIRHDRDALADRCRELALQVSGLEERIEGERKALQEYRAGFVEGAEEAIRIRIADACAQVAAAGARELEKRDFRFGAIHDRIATIADEAFGPFPVQSLEENIIAIERGIFEQRCRTETSIVNARWQAEEMDRLRGIYGHETSASIAAWQDETFGPATTTLARADRSDYLIRGSLWAALCADLSIPRPNLSRAIRAVEELAELIILLVADDADPKAPEEVADIDIVLRGIDASHGVDRADTVTAKMKKNRARRWHTTGDGHGQHVEGEP